MGRDNEAFEHIKVVGKEERTFSSFVQGYTELPVRLHKKGIVNPKDTKHGVINGRLLLWCPFISGCLPDQVDASVEG